MAAEEEDVLSRLRAFLMFVVLAWSPGLLAQEAPSSEAPDATISVDNLSAISGAVEVLIDQKKIAGAVVMVAHQGRVVFTEAQGFQDIRAETPMEVDTIFRIYSMTKPVTAVAALMLWERGALDLDAPVETYLPELAGQQVYISRWSRAPLSRAITVRDLMRHTAGMTYGFFSSTRVDRMYLRDHPIFAADQDAMIARLAELPLLHQPGERWHYSVSSDVLGALVERVSGQPLGVFFQENIFAPLGMVDTAFAVPDASIARFASSYMPGMVRFDDAVGSDFRDASRLQSGGGGLISTAGDYMRFCQMLLDGGVFDGQRFLEAATIQEMTRDHLSPDAHLFEDSPSLKSIFSDYGYGLGVAVRRRDSGTRGHAGEYGWDGAASTHFWISPQDGLILIALSQRQPYTSQLKDVLTPLVYQSLQP